MTSTTTVDCSGTNTSANNGTYPTRKAQESREDNNEKQRTPDPYLRKYYHVLGVRMLWEKPCHSGENHSSVKEDSVKRRRDDDNLTCADGQTVLTLG
jgi:hypothetical protein